MIQVKNDLSGKVCMITGATSGIGRSAALALGDSGASLVLVARDRLRGERIVEEIIERTGNSDVELMLADLASQEQVRRLAEVFLSKDRPLHVLFNNAGVWMLKREETVDGLEVTFALNHLAYFLLTNLLLERLKASAPARIVNTASDAYVYARGRLDANDLQSKTRFSAMQVYGKSKLANILFTREMARRLKGTGVTCNCFHPGFVGTNLARNNGILASIGMLLTRPFARTPERGAETGVYLCTSPEVVEVSGKYFFDCKPRWPKRFAQNDEDALALWQASERLSGSA